jgi:Mn-containing catalase
MAGLVEEGEEVMQDGKEKEDAPADLTLIGAAQRVEYYEMAAYTTARNLAVQMRSPRSSSFSHRRWAKNKTRGNCSIS